MTIEQIYMPLLDEGVDVRRPVHAEKLSGQVYRIVEQDYDHETETWAFPPGTEVVCEVVASSEGPILAAVAKAKGER